jgi:hypothetical protein
MLTPPTRSASFSRFASQRAATDVAPRSESANTDEPRARLDERVGVDRHEEVRLYLPRFFDACLQRNEIVAVANEKTAQAGFAVELRLQAARDGERHVLFIDAAAALGARILAAMPCVDGDDQRARGCSPRFPRRRGRLLSPIALVADRVLVRLQDQARHGGHRRGRCRLLRGLLFSLALRHQRHQRIGRHERIHVHHQTVAVVADRFEMEHLRLCFALEIEHDAQHAGFETAHPHRLDVGIVARDLRPETVELGTCSHVLQVQHEPVGVLDRGQAEPDRRRRLESDARVLGGGPHARGRDPCFLREGSEAGDEAGGEQGGDEPEAGERTQVRR